MQHQPQKTKVNKHWTILSLCWRNTSEVSAVSRPLYEISPREGSFRSSMPSVRVLRRTGRRLHFSNTGWALAQA